MMPTTCSPAPTRSSTTCAIRKKTRKNASPRCASGCRPDRRSWAAVERWRSLSVGPVAYAPVTGPVVDTGRTRPAMTERIALLLAQDSARTWSPEQVHQALDAPVASVYSSLSRLEKRGRLVRVNHGAYRAAPPAGRG
ncbi:hypothetical protein QQM39_39845 [Streptomyces sp. DT2A-34]|uniref:hypothetical protein n=1 Tax=Streptomyces sp. DT2A-34 TaxID=3051182 RepID=UPI00265BF2F4|nr:hypothetical protein [Streptomyces sp. DT2A-34]MDO0916750.1 hypothetical protein [Streptomyces sp. DT2A-34]